MQIILSIVFDSRATAALQAVEFLKPLICLLIDPKQSPNASLNSFISICKDDGRAEIGEENKENRQQRYVGLFYDAVMAMNQRE